MTRRLDGPPARAISLRTQIDEQVESWPDRDAVVFRRSATSYAELDDAADELATALRADGVAPGSRVGVLLERSVDLIAALLAVVKAGAAYVPLDPTYPPARLARNALQMRAQLCLISDEASRLVLPAATPTIILPNPDHQCHSSKPVGQHADASEHDLAYIVFTSGSTGRPKGIAMPWGPLENLLAWQHRRFLRPGPRRTCSSSPQ